MLWDRHRSQMEIFYSLNYCNPFSAEYFLLERTLLGRFFCNPQKERQTRIVHLAQTLLKDLRYFAVGPANTDPHFSKLYENLSLFFLFNFYKQDFDNFSRSAVPKKGELKILFFEDFLDKSEYYLGSFSERLSRPFKPAHWFSCSFQMWRAAHEISETVIGNSSKMHALRCSIWQSIFTHDARRHMASCYEIMRDIPTLVLGPPGSGKGAVAQAIANSQFVPFDPDTRTFPGYCKSAHSSVNFASLCSTDVESELFGRNSDFVAGANQDRVGLFELCKNSSTIYLNEIADSDNLTQVKLLQIFQYRTFQRTGDARTRHFLGKIVASSSVELEAEVQARRFRADLFSSLRADRINVPALKAQLENAPDDLRGLVLFITTRIVGTEQAQALTEQVMVVIRNDLSASYTWPGNVRELEQCVRHVMMHNTYSPYKQPDQSSEGALDDFQVRGTAEEVLSHYCTSLYAKTGNYEEAARIANLDRRTFKAKINESILRELRTKATGNRSNYPGALTFSRAFDPSGRGFE